MSTDVVKANTDKEIAAAAKKAAHALRAGKLVGFPTETVYGVAAVATSAAAMRRLRQLKSRPSRPFSVHVAGPGDAVRYVRDIPDHVRRLMAEAWPGPVTLLLPVGGRLADERLQRAGLYDVLTRRDIIGLRCPDSPVAEAMLSAVDAPVVAPSANPAGASSPRTAKQVLRHLDGRIDLLIDAGPTRYGLDSTVVRFGADGWKIIRQGALDERTVGRLLRRKLLFVCTGNTCRSPMAVGLAKKLLASRLGCRVGELRKRGLEVISAGVCGMPGGAASPEAVRAVRKLGADISHHRSQKLTPQLINDADMIFCMTDFHVAEACRLVVSAATKITRLDPAGDISDPIGSGAEGYRGTAERIQRVLKNRLEKVMP